MKKCNKITQKTSHTHINKDLNEKKDKYDFNSIKETIKIVMENPKGFSKYFPGGKTKGLTSDELSIILTKIAKDIEDNDKKY